jgi:hypothetical protein
MVPDTIPGVLDGLVTTSSGPDGGVSLHVVAGTDDARAAGCWHIELVLHPEHAELLGAVLLRARQRSSWRARRRGGWIPCWLGLRQCFPGEDGDQRPDA